jgi:hypothetical protein
MAEFSRKAIGIAQCFNSSLGGLGLDALAQEQGQQGPTKQTMGSGISGRKSGRIAGRGHCFQAALHKQLC